MAAVALAVHRCRPDASYHCKGWKASGNTCAPSTTPTASACRSCPEALGLGGGTYTCSSFYPASSLSFTLLPCQHAPPAGPPDQAGVHALTVLPSPWSWQGAAGHGRPTCWSGMHACQDLRSLQWTQQHKKLRNVCMSGLAQPEEQQCNAKRSGCEPAAIRLRTKVTEPA